MCTRKLKNLRLALTQYLLHCSGLEPNPQYLRRMPVNSNSLEHLKKGKTVHAFSQSGCTVVLCTHSHSEVLILLSIYKCSSDGFRNWPGSQWGYTQPPDASAGHSSALWFTYLTATLAKMPSLTLILLSNAGRWTSMDPWRMRDGALRWAFNKGKHSFSWPWFDLKPWTWDFPGGLVVKTLCFQHRGHEFNPWSGKIPYALWPKNTIF